MTRKISPDHFYKLVVADVLRSEPTDDEILCLMMLIVYCHIVVNSKANLNCDIDRVETTERHAAELAASLFSKKPKSHYIHWYWKWHSDWTQYAHELAVPANLRSTLIAMREKFESHPWVERLEDIDEIGPLAVLDKSG